ncbi:MAG: ArsR/SmtB family transcription factor, partial [Actinomycetes bacterium]
PRFFVLGIKSYGRTPTFLLRVGWEQVDEVFASLDRELGALLPAEDRSMALDVAGCCAPLGASEIDGADAAVLAEAFKALGDPVRLRLLSLLATAEDGEVCACDLVEPVGKSQPTVSHHLKVLRDAGLVTATKRGVNIWYAVVPAQLEALRGVLQVPQPA